MDKNTKDLAVTLALILFAWFCFVYIATPAPIVVRQQTQVTAPNYGFGTVERLNEPTIKLNPQ